MPGLLVVLGAKPPARPTTIYNSTYAVARVSPFSPAAAWYFPFYLYFVFALYERKNEIQKKMKYHCARSHLGHRVSPIMLSPCRRRITQRGFGPLQHWIATGLQCIDGRIVQRHAYVRQH